MTETTTFYPLSALPLDEAGAIPPEVIDTMVLNGQAEQAALSGLGWMIKCGDPRHHHQKAEGVTLVGVDRRIKVGAACAMLSPAVDIPRQPQDYEPHRAHQQANRDTEN